MTNTCPICDEGTLTPQEEWCELEYLGEVGYLPAKYSICDTCDSAVASKFDTMYNANKARQFKKDVHLLLGKPRGWTPITHTRVVCKDDVPLSFLC